MSKEAKPLSYEFPDSLKKSLKRGEYAVYQLVDISYKDGKFSGRTCGIPNKDVVYDSEGNLTPIAFVEGYNPDGTARFGNIWFSIDNECIVMCMSGAKHASMYNYLEVSNFNESNPNRDQNISPLYRRVDSLTNAKQTRGERAARVSALKAVMSMSDEEVQKFISSNKSSVPVKLVSKPDGSMDWEAVRDRFERWVEQNPETFLSLTDGKKGDSDSAIEDLISSAIEKKLIGFDRETKSWYGANGKPFLTVKMSKDNMHVAELVAYLKSPAGLKLHERIKDSK